MLIPGLATKTNITPMSNKITKILILGFAVMIAVAGIVLFIFTALNQPPTNMEFENLHLLTLEENIASLSEKGDERMEHRDSLYAVVVDKLELYRLEGFLTQEQIDDQTKALVHGYLPVFVSYCEKKFLESSWLSDNQLTKMSSKIAMLRGLYVEGEPVVTQMGQIDVLERLSDYIANYRRAKNIVGKSGRFEGIEKSNSLIEDAATYAAMAPLKYNETLKRLLASVKRKQGIAHYNFVKGKIDLLRDFKRLPRASFVAQNNSTKDALQTYRDNRFRYGFGENEYAERSLNEDARVIYSNAADHYIFNLDNTKGEWATLNNNPDPGKYYAYKSESNHHKPNSRAMMSVKFRGYDTFEFYIRSNGESNWDYVLVSVDDTPHGNNYFATTKGSASNIATLDGYRKVIVPNLSVEDEHTIYIVYQKDGSDDRGDDRGYVLIPKPIEL